jgi:hypothetical protein
MDIPVTAITHIDVIITIPPGITGTGIGVRRIEGIVGAGREAEDILKAIEDGAGEAVKVGVVEAEAGALEEVAVGFDDYIDEK